MSDSNITAFDIKLFMGLLIAVVGISIVFPMAGLGNPDAETAQIPTFEPDANTVDFAGEFPTRPDTQSGGVLATGQGRPYTETYRVLYDQSGEYEPVTDRQAFSEQIDPTNPQIFIRVDGPTDTLFDNGTDYQYTYTAYAFNENTPTTATGGVDISEIDAYENETWINTLVWNGTAESDSRSITVRTPEGGSGTTLSATFSVNPSRVHEPIFEPDNFDLNDTSSYQLERPDTNVVLNYDIDSLNTPDDTSLFGGIPVVGDLVSGGSGIFGGIVLLVQQIGWVFGTIFTIITNTIITVANAASFGVGLITYLVGSYTSVVVAAPSGLAATVLAFPGILLGIQGFRLIMVIVNTVWVG